MESCLRAIEAIEIEEYEGSVYNLKTESEEYVVAGVIVHNCPHLWETRPARLAKGDCIDLWMGE